MCNQSPNCWPHGWPACPAWGEARPGDFFMSRASDTLRGRAMAKACGTPYIHGGIHIGDGRIVHASQDFAEGARLGHVQHLRGALWSRIEMTDWQRDKIVDYALGALGTPFPPRWAMAVGVIRGHSGDVTRPASEQPRWVRTLLNGEKTAYCLQIVSRAYSAAGIELVNDGRPEGLIRPSDLLPLVGISERVPV